MAGAPTPENAWSYSLWLIRGHASKSIPTESVIAPLSIPAPEPVRRRLALPDGAAETACLRVIIPFVPEQKLLEEAARNLLRRIPALCLKIEYLPGISSPFIVAGPEPEITFLWKSQAAKTPLSLNGHQEGNERNRVVLVIEPLASGKSAFTLQAPAICADQRSLEIMIRQILDRLAGGPGIESADQPSYFDVAQWMRELIQSVDGAQGKLFWRRTLKQQTLSVSSCRPENISAEICFQTPWPQGFAKLEPEQREAWAALAWLRVARVMSGKYSIALGCVADGRSDEQLHQVIGPLSRLIPLRGPAPGTGTADAAHMTADALKKGQQWPELFLLEDLAAEAEGTGDVTYFDYAFDYQKEASCSATLQLENVNADVEPYMFLLQCRELEGELSVCIRTRAAAADVEHLHTLTERWLNVLEASLQTPERPLDDFNVLTKKEREAIPWSGPAFAVEGTFHETLSSACRKYGDRIAVSCPGREISFAKLESLSSGLAALLPRVPETVIAVQVDRSPELILSLVAILKAGGVFLPVNSNAPEPYRQRLLQRSGATLLISDQPQPWAEACGWDVLDVQAAISALRTLSPSAWTPPPVHPDQLAYVLFTSGSTAEPEAAAISHRSMLNLWHGLNSAIPELRGTDRVGMNGPISFDTSIKQLVQLLSGRTIVMIPEETRIDPAALATHLTREEIEVADFTPSHLDLVYDGSRPALQKPPTLILLGGEALREQLCRRLQNYRVYNLYGLTECAVDSLVGPVDASSTPGTLGPPLSNVEVVAADAFWSPVPDEVRGELLISGKGLARGYFRSPARTAEKFIPNPRGTPGSRAFRTGDMVKRSTAGFFRYLGRRGNQVKIRGYRVSLSEIQSMIEAQPGVAAAVVASRESLRDSEQLIAWVVPTLPYSPVVNGCSRYTVNGLSMAGLNQHETAFLYGEVFERNAYLRNGLFLPQGACVFDVGANCGLFSLRAHLGSPGARIFAFEPNPEVYQCLMANVAIFGISGQFLPIALGRECGSAEFTSYLGFSLLSGFHADRESDLAVVREYIRQQQPQAANADNELMEEVLAQRFETHCHRREVTTVSNVIREFQIPKIDLLKVNVEKSEANVLEGIEPGDWEKIQQVTMEVHDIDGRLEQITTLLNSKGFKTITEKDWSLPGSSSINYYLYATRHPERGGAAVPAPSVDDLPRPLTEQDLRHALAAKLPDYAVPSRIMVLDRMPLNDHGKVDRTALDAILTEACNSEQKAAVRTELEEQLLKEWQQILERRDIGIETHFLEAGGDSFSIMQLNLRLRRQFDLDLPVVDMFRHPNIRLLAQHLDSLQEKSN